MARWASRTKSKRGHSCVAESEEGFRPKKKQQTSIEEEFSEVLNPPNVSPGDIACSFQTKKITIKFGKNNNGLSSSTTNTNTNGVGRKGNGKAKRRDNDLHRLVFLPNGLPDKTTLAYCVKGQTMLEGYKLGDGIVCSCCNTAVSPSQFEAHAGWAAKRQPYRHIYTSHGLTLHDICISLAKNGQIHLTNKDGDGIETSPEPEFGIETSPQPEFDASTTEWDITRPEFGETSAFQVGGCAICEGHDFSTSKFDDRTILICHQCQKELHVGCLRDCGLCDLKQLPQDKWFCNDCKTIQAGLQNLVDNGAEMIPASILNTIKNKYSEKGGALNDHVQWQILSGESQSPEQRELLSRAAKLFKKCFDPNLIPVMVYGRDIHWQQFGGMHCVVLLVNSVVVSAGLVRIFGREVAELPLVATRKEHQGKGYFKALFSCIQSLLSSLNVENMVLPATEKVESLWTEKLGFQRMSEERLFSYTRYLQLTSFNGTSMLEKKVEHMTEL